jgi:hypothetical protein
MFRLRYGIARQAMIEAQSGIEYKTLLANLGQCAA